MVVEEKEESSGLGSMAMIDIQMIIILSVIDTIIDLIIFKLFRIKYFTVLISFFVNFMVPVIWIWIIARSGMPFSEQVPIVVDIFASYMINLVNFVVSGIFGLMISIMVCTITGSLNEI